MPPRSSFSICLSIFSFSREGSKATLVLVCPIFFFRIFLFEASSQGNPETSTDSPSPEFSSQVCSNSNSSCITSKPDALSSSIPLMFGFTNHSLSLFAFLISWSVASSALTSWATPTGQKERIVLDSIERCVGYGAICEGMSLCAFFTTTLFLPSRTWFVFDALIGLDAWFLSRANDFRCGTRAELMAHFTTLSPSWDILLSLKRVFLSWDKLNCLLLFELLRILFTLYDSS